MFRPFLTSEAGAVTVEKTIVVGGIIGLAIAVFGALRSSTELAALSTVKAMSGATYEKSFELPGPPNKSWGGAYTGVVDGWRTNHGTLEFHRYTKADGTEGYALELEGSGKGNVVASPIENLIPNKPYTVSFDMIAGAGEGMDVYFGGERVASIGAGVTGDISTQTIEITSGMGNGTDWLSFHSVGKTDGHSSKIDNVKVF